MDRMTYVGVKTEEKFCLVTVLWLAISLIPEPSFRR
jgi:hypothetical protein